MKTVRTTVSLSSEQHEKLQALAEANGLSIAWVVRQAVGEFLDRLEAETPFRPISAASGKREEDQQ